MSAQIIQFIPRANPNRLTSQELELAANAIFKAINDPMAEMIPTDEKVPDSA